MKTNTLIGSVALMAGLLAASSARATVTLTFDENGNGPVGFTHEQHSDTLSASVAGGSLTGDSVPSGGGATTLSYLYQSTAVSGYFEYGWVAIYDAGPNGTQGPLSDLIHFDNSTQINGSTYLQMFFYSSDNDGDLADNWVSAATQSAILSSGNLVSVIEDANGVATYTPANMSSPGYIVDYPGPTAGPDQYSFQFVSSSVPEASTMIAGALLVLPFGASTLRILRRNRMA